MTDEQEHDAIVRHDGSLRLAEKMLAEAEAARTVIDALIAEIRQETVRLRNGGGGLRQA